MTELERTDLARERTHAAWLRTCLAFVISALALRHYAVSDVTSVVMVGVLGGGGALSACRAMILAPDHATKYLAVAMIISSLAAVTIHIHP